MYWLERRDSLWQRAHIAVLLQDRAEAQAYLASEFMKAGCNFACLLQRSDNWLDDWLWLGLFTLHDQSHKRSELTVAQGSLIRREVLGYCACNAAVCPEAVSLLEIGLTLIRARSLKSQVTGEQGTTAHPVPGGKGVMPAIRPKAGGRLRAPT